MLLRPTLTIRTPAQLDAALEGLVAENVAQRRAGIVPSLANARHVRYRRELPGREEWDSAYDVWRKGWGDCEDLAAWLAADLRVAGHSEARAITVASGPNLRHCIVQVGTRRFDPSKARGMKGRA